MSNRHEPFLDEFPRVGTGFPQLQCLSCAKNSTQENCVVGDTISWFFVMKILKSSKLPWKSWKLMKNCLAGYFQYSWNHENCLAGKHLLLHINNSCHVMVVSPWKLTLGTDAWECGFVQKRSTTPNAFHMSGCFFKLGYPTLPHISASHCFPHSEHDHSWMILGSHYISISALGRIKRFKPTHQSTCTNGRVVRPCRQTSVERLIRRWIFFFLDFFLIKGERFLRIFWGKQFPGELYRTHFLKKNWWWDEVVGGFLGNKHNDQASLGNH